MSETVTKQGHPSPRAKATDPLQDSLDELARIADSLVDELAADPPDDQPAEPTPAQPVEQSPGPVAAQPVEPTPKADPRAAQGRREALKETLDQLDKLVEDPSPPPRPVEIEVGGDRGEDIQAQLDSLLAPASAAAVEVTPEPTDAKAEAKAEAVEEAPISVATAAVEPPAVAPPEPSPAEVQIDEKIEAEPTPVVRRETGRRSGRIWWLIGVVVVLAGAAAVYWFLEIGGGFSRSDAGNDIPLPDPPVVYTKPAATEPAARAITEAEPVADPVVPRIEAPVAAPRPAPTPAATTQPPRPRAAPVRPAVAARAVEESTSGSLPSATAAETAMILPQDPPTRTNEPGPQLASVGGVVLPSIVQIPADELELPSADDLIAEQVAEPIARPVPKVIAAPPVPDDQPPVVLQRIEPEFEPRSLRPGQQETVALRVLVSERGRVVRVVVDESTPGSEIEAAAINAVLRWTYDPARENGEAVRRWTTERFEFERPAD